MTYVKLLSHHRRLGRHVEHDPRSRLYGYRKALPIHSIQHHSNIEVLDQGNLGSCTGNAAVGCVGYDPFYATVSVRLNEELAVIVYSKATHLDEVPGEYPPDDTGSTGLGVAKAMTALGLISGYLWMFSFLDVLGALMQRPLIVGTYWYESMFNPDRFGVVTPAGRIAGGHEYILDGWDEATGLLSFRNSWGTRWGQGGRFYMTPASLTRLLAEDGDATLFVPTTEPPPQPTPPAPEPVGCRTLDW